MTKELRIEAIWPSGRVVPIRVKIEPIVAGEDIEGLDRGPSIRWIDRGALTSRDTLLAFLKDLTRAVDASETARALCLESDQAELYRWLPYEPGEPQPVQVTLPKDA
jgi:hypothetical protein